MRRASAHAGESSCIGMALEIPDDGHELFLIYLECASRMKPNRFASADGIAYGERDHNTRYSTGYFDERVVRRIEPRPERAVSDECVKRDDEIAEIQKVKIPVLACEPTVAGVNICCNRTRAMAGFDILV
jgi:hypothetical protein